MALLALLAAVEARRIKVQRIRPAAASAEDELVDQDGLPQQVQYYAAPDDRADTRGGRVVLVADALNGLSPSVYAGRSASAATRSQDDAPLYRASPRALNASPSLAPRTHASKEQHTKVRTSPTKSVELREINRTLAHGCIASCLTLCNLYPRAGPARPDHPQLQQGQ